jgi:hypothetical protein
MSDIWAEFEKIAVSQGLISTAEDDDKKEDKPKSRSGLSEDAISLLYGIEPDSIYKNKDLIEVAHPDTAVILPCYDAMNAIVENENQRHDMSTYIALKEPNGKLIQRRYIEAKKDLMSSLVKAAFVLDNKNESELMSLADSCVVSLDKRGDQITKEATGILAGIFSPTGAAVAGAAALIGGLYYLGYGAPTAQSVFVNSQRVLEKLQSFSSKPYAAGIQMDVGNLITMANDLYSVKDELTKVTSVDAAVDIAKQQSEQAKVEDIKKKIARYKEQLNKVFLAIPDWVNKIKIAASTSKEETSDFWSKIKNIADPFYNTDEEDLIEELYGKDTIFGITTSRSGGLYEAIQKDIQAMNLALSSADKHVPQIQESLAKEPLKNPYLEEQNKNMTPKDQPAQPKDQGYFLNDDLQIGNTFQVV